MTVKELEEGQRVFYCPRNTGESILAKVIQKRGFKTLIETKTGGFRLAVFTEELNW